MPKAATHIAALSHVVTPGHVTAPCHARPRRATSSSSAPPGLTHQRPRLIVRKDCREEKDQIEEEAGFDGGKTAQRLPLESLETPK